MIRTLARGTDVNVRGTVKNGKVLLNNPKAIADGTEVVVRPVTKRKTAAKSPKSKRPPLSMAERLKDFIGKAPGLPPDAAQNVDHYLYGLPQAVMKAVFADTSYFVALAGPKDHFHARAVEFCDNWLGRIITTDYVIVETAGMLSRTKDRPAFVNLLHSLQADPAVEIIPASPKLIRTGCELFARRSDKEWSLVDCISMIVMNKRRMGDAVTTDHHFKQAGFRALLTDE